MTSCLLLSNARALGHTCSRSTGEWLLTLQSLIFACEGPSDDGKRRSQCFHFPSVISSAIIFSVVIIMDWVSWHHLVLSVKKRMEINKYKTWGKDVYVIGNLDWKNWLKLARLIKGCSSMTSDKSGHTGTSRPLQDNRTQFCSIQFSYFISFWDKRRKELVCLFGACFVLKTFN